MFFIITFCGALVLLLIQKLAAFFESQRVRKGLVGIEKCRPVRRYPQDDDPFGFKWVKTQWKAYNNQYFLDAALKRFESVGDTYQAHRIGNTFIQTRDPENVKAILATNFQDWSLGGRIIQMGPFLGKGIFTTDGKAWEHSRALVRPNFTRMQVRNLENLEHHVNRLVNRIPGDGSMVDLQELFFGLTIDSATELLFGESVDSLLDTDHTSHHHKFVEAYDFCQAKAILRPRNAVLEKLKYDSEFFAKCDIVHKYVEAYVEKALERMQGKKTLDEEVKGRYVFLEELANETTDKTVLRDEVLNVLLAGRDTTASLLSNTFHVLARRHDIWTALREEVESLAGSPPNYDELRELKLVRFVLNESLRLYPVVPMNQRIAVRDTILPHGGGALGLEPFVVNKGQAVTYHVYSMHRRKDIYGEDVEEFRPARWETLRPGWGYLPFNGGPRICPGQQFALTEAAYTLVRIVQQFSTIEAQDNLAWKEMLGMTTTSFHGTKVRLTRD